MAWISNTNASSWGEGEPALVSMDSAQPEDAPQVGSTGNVSAGFTG
jgi:hypothetical protein